jgi:hypothetical protein
MLLSTGMSLTFQLDLALPSGMGSLSEGPLLDLALSHEYGHQVQFQKVVDFKYIPETAGVSQFIDFLADAMAAYHGHHPRGATFQIKCLIEMVWGVYAVGGCNFESLGHHGSPIQRARAVQWAADLIDNSKPKKAKGRILPAVEFIQKFNAVYESYFVAPDAED